MPHPDLHTLLADLEHVERAIWRTLVSSSEHDIILDNGNASLPVSVQRRFLDDSPCVLVEGKQGTWRCLLQDSHKRPWNSDMDHVVDDRGRHKRQAIARYRSFPQNLPIPQRRRAKCNVQKFGAVLQLPWRAQRIDGCVVDCAAVHSDAPDQVAFGAVRARSGGPEEFAVLRREPVKIAVLLPYDDGVFAGRCVWRRRDEC